MKPGASQGYYTVLEQGPRSQSFRMQSQSDECYNHEENYAMEPVASQRMTRVSSARSTLCCCSSSSCRCLLLRLFRRCPGAEPAASLASGASRFAGLPHGFAAESVLVDPDKLFTASGASRFAGRPRGFIAEGVLIDPEKLFTGIAM